MPSRRIYSRGYQTTPSTVATNLNMAADEYGITWNMSLPDTADLNIAADGKYYFGIDKLSVRWGTSAEGYPTFTMPVFAPEPYVYNDGNGLVGSTTPPLIEGGPGTSSTVIFEHPVRFNSAETYPTGTAYEGSKLAWVIDRAAWLAISANDAIWVSVLGAEGFPWWFRKGADTSPTASYTNSLDMYGAFVDDLYNDRHPISYYDYVTAPTAPTGLTITNVDSSLFTYKVKVSWSAPTDDGGSPITGYRIQWTQDNWAHTNTQNITGTATSTVLEIKNSNTFKFRVVAKNDVVSHFGTFGPYVEATHLVTRAVANLDGWALYGTVTGVTRTLTRTAPLRQESALDSNIAAWEISSGVALKVKSTATGTVTVPTNTIGIKRTFTGLEVGAEYRVFVGSVDFAVKPYLLSNVPANKYRLKVNTSTPTVSTAFTPTESYSTGDYFELIFTATSTSHDISIELTETLTGVTGDLEDITFPFVLLERTVNDAQFKVQDTVFKGSIADHFDLVCNSVGARWWVDRSQLVRFSRDYGSAPVIATFTDTDPNDEGKLHYKDIATSSTTKGVVNNIELTNLGATIDAKKTSELEARDVIWLDTDFDSASDYGFRGAKITTNIYQPQANTNRVPNPRFDKTSDYVFKVNSDTSMKLKRVKIEDVATNTNHFLTTSGSVQSSKYALSVTALSHATDYRILFGADGEHGKSVTEMKGFPIIPKDQFNIQGTTTNPTYKARVYWRAGKGDKNATSVSKIWIIWYDAKGDYLSASTVVSEPLLEGSWSATEVSATAPTGAYFAAIATMVETTLANNDGRTWYVTAASFTYDSFDYGGGTYNTFFDGNTEDTNTWLYTWEGETGASASSVYQNTLDDVTQDILDRYATYQQQIHSITWNALEDWVAAKALDINAFIDIEFQGVTGKYRVIGLEHDITANSWMMKIHVEKV
jgi:hypothetical protein